MTSRLFLAAAAVALAMAPSFAADQTPAAAPPAQPAATAPAAPPIVFADALKKAMAVMDAASEALAKGGITGLLPHIGDLEEALAGADAVYAAAAADPEGPVVLADGPAEAAHYSGQATRAAEKAGGDSKPLPRVMPDPYPAISFYLGTYYNEIRRSEEALRALDKGLALVAAHGTRMGQFMPSLTSERAIALIGVGRFAEALAVYDDGLQLPGLSAQAKARMYRGRGYTLVELGRLDEGEAAYRESLKLEPDNRIALHELDYIAHLRAGGAKAPGETVAPGNKPAADQPADSQSDPGI